MMIEMTINGISLDPFTNMPFIILEDAEKKKKIPIWIGLFEASAIATELEQIKLARPMTHDLIRGLLESVDAKLKRIEIHNLKDNTFYARLILDVGGKEKIVDSRPSDAIAVALRTKSPIFVDEKVVEAAKKIELSSKVSGKDKVSKEKWKEILENLSPEDFGKYKM